MQPRAVQIIVLDHDIGAETRLAELLIKGESGLIALRIEQAHRLIERLTTFPKISVAAANANSV